MLALPRRAHHCSRSPVRAGSTFVVLTLRRPLAAVPLTAVLAMLAACGGGTTDPPPDMEVARVEVTATAASVHENGTVQLSARALTASGTALPGKVFTWQSGNAAVATVDGGGLVSGVAPGSATIAAAETASGKSGTLTVTVTPAPVNAVAVSAPQARVKSGKQLQLSVTLTDATGRVLTAREVTWSTSAPLLATVSGTGVVDARAPGNVTITATSEGKSGSVSLEVFQLAPARVSISPELTVLAIGETVQLRAVPVDAEGDTIPVPLPLAVGPVLAATGEPGVYRGAALGHATVHTQLGGVSSNTAVVAVLGAGELLAAAVPEGPRNRRRGDRVTVPVILDMSRVVNPGDLGALELEIGYDNFSLELKSATPGVAGSISEGGVPGRYRFAFASASPTTSARLTLVTLVFEVTPGARPGSILSVNLTFPSAPASTGFAAYPQPVVVNGGMPIIGN
jgi:hypothetical protein